MPSSVKNYGMSRMVVFCVDFAISKEKIQSLNNKVLFKVYKFGETQNGQPRAKSIESQVESIVNV